MLCDHTEQDDLDPYAQATFECRRGDLAYVTEMKTTATGALFICVRLLENDRLVNCTEDAVQKLSPLEVLALQAE